jgi:hypothetical protein
VLNMMPAAHKTGSLLIAGNGKAVVDSSAAGDAVLVKKNFSTVPDATRRDGRA